MIPIPHFEYSRVTEFCCCCCLFCCCSSSCFLFDYSGLAWQLFSKWKLTGGGVGSGYVGVCTSKHSPFNFNHFIFWIIFKNCCLPCKKGGLTVLQFTVYLYFLRCAENGRGCCGAAWLFLCQRAHHLRSLRAVWARSSFLLDFCPLCVCVCMYGGRGGVVCVCVCLCACVCMLPCVC